MKYFLYLLFLVSPAAMYAQNVNTATIVWNSTSTFDVQTGTTDDEWTTFTTFGSSQIEWKAANGAVLKNYTVTSVIGTWTNAGQPGKITFEVTSDQLEGTITIQRVGSDIRIKAFLSTATGETDLKEFTIGHYRAQ